jgi:hypothetical protein
MGYVDEVLSWNKEEYQQQLEAFCENLAQCENYYDVLDKKEAQRTHDEAIKALQKYRDEELAFMYESFYNENSPFNRLRKEFVYKRVSKNESVSLSFKPILEM